MIQFIRTHYGKIGMSFALVMLIINYFQTQELNKLRSENKPQIIEVLENGDIAKGQLIDSLQSELFNANNMVGRYELTLDYLKEVNPKAAKDFENYFYKETE